MKERFNAGCIGSPGALEDKRKKDAVQAER
jgi:hypothetical protein